MTSSLAPLRGTAVRLLVLALIAYALVDVYVGRRVKAASITAVDLSTYVRVGRFDLPEPTRTVPPANSLLAQEASGVTYNWDTNTLFVVGDGGTSVVEVSKTGALLSSMTLAPGNSPQGTEFYDTEGIAYIGNGKFVLVEERDRQANLFTYVAGSVLHRSDAKTVKLGASIGNIGLEGVSYDPMTGGYIFVKEKDPQSIFQTGIDFAAGTATNGSATTDESVDLFAPALANVADFSDVFALSNLPDLNGQADFSHLLIISQESGQVINIDRSGKVFSKLTIAADPGSPLSVPDMTMEGVTMDRDGVLYVVNENGGGDANHPQLWVYAHSSTANQAPTGVKLQNAVSSIAENTSTASPLKLADIVVTDDGLGNNNLTASGPDAGAFQIVGTGLFLKAGTVLSSAGKPSYSVTVNVDDPAVGNSPDATVDFHLQVTAPSGGTTNVIVSEVAPWSSGNSSLGADWFEVTNIGSAAVDITGWKMDDNSNSFGVAVDLKGITSVAPGESVIFIESDTPATIVPAFKTLWFGANPPAKLQIGTYSGSGVGLSTGGDTVNLYNGVGVLQASLTFGVSPSGPSFSTFDNSGGLNNTTISLLSKVGVNGAVIASGDANEIGSPGLIGASSTPTVTIIAADADAAESGQNPGTFRITRSGSTVNPLTVNYTLATGAGQATSADYTPALTGAATIPAGQSFLDITITPVDDSLVEGPETVTLTLGDTGSYDVGAPGTATVTITDNDALNKAPTAVALNNKVSTLNQDTSTASAIKVADIAVSDDGLGTDDLSLSGPDAGSFQITGPALYLKAGTTLNSAAKASYSVTVNVDDPTVGSTPDASVAYTLTILPALAAGSVVITEVAPWSSGNSSLAADWFEVTNISSNAVNIAGWKMDDNSNSFGSAVALNGIASIAPGESVIFIESASADVVAAFKTLWFGANAPAKLQIGTYSGSGVGLSTSSDAVNLYDGAGVLQASVTFGASPAGPQFPTFDNAAGLNNAAISRLSEAGVHNAMAAANDANEIGSPGTVGDLAITEVAPWSSSNSSIAADWFEVTNTSAHAVDITGWKMDDNSNSFGVAVDLKGIASIAPGESVIFIESDAPATVVAAFKTLWFGANPPANLQIGTYSGSGVGLSTSSDAVNLFNGAGVLQASVTFGASPSGPSFPTFDNAAGLSNVTIFQRSAVGRYQAFASSNDANEIGSPGTVGGLVITEVAPWSSGSPLGADWFEVTNTSAHAVDITGWKMDDNSNSFGSAVALNGIAGIAPGESVIFIESDAPATVVPAFKTLWFGANAPAGLQIGTYSGSGVGLSTSGDAVNLFNSAGVLQASVTFGASPAGPAFPTFDNSDGLDNTAISQLSATGIHNAVAAANDANEIGSPGTIGKLFIASVNVAGGGGDQSAPNTWLEIKGQVLAPANTAAGLLWSDAPEFAQGKMPTTLGGVSVTVNGRPAYIYYVSPTQVNALTSLDSTTGPVDVIVNNGTTTIAAFTVVERAVSPAFLLFGATKYIAATHADNSYLGPASLSVPGAAFTPAHPNETIVLYAVGFGLPSSALTEGSSKQSSPLPELPVIQIGGVNAKVDFAGVVAPGLYQFNVTVPGSVSDGDNAVSATYRGIQTPGALITVQH